MQLVSSFLSTASTAAVAVGLGGWSSGGGFAARGHPRCLSAGLHHCVATAFCLCCYCYCYCRAPGYCAAQSPTQPNPNFCLRHRGRNLWNLCLPRSKLALRRAEVETVHVGSGFLSSGSLGFSFGAPAIRRCAFGRKRMGLCRGAKRSPDELLGLPVRP